MLSWDEFNLSELDENSSSEDEQLSEDDRKPSARGASKPVVTKKTEDSSSFVSVVGRGWIAGTIIGPWSASYNIVGRLVECHCFFMALKLKD